MNRAKFLAMRSRCGPRRRLSSPQLQEPDNFSGADMEHQPHSVTFGMRTLADPEAVSSSRHFALGVQRLGNQSLCNIVLNKSCLWSAQWNYRILALGGVTVVGEWISTIEFRRFRQSSSAHRRTPLSIILEIEELDNLNQNLDG